MAQLPADAFFEQLLAPYPPPPPFWKHFTTTNFDRVKDVSDAESLPYDLRVLQPPPPPKHADSYSAFQHHYAIPPVPTLPPEHEELVFDPSTLTSATGTARPHAKLLWQLIKSLNLNFLELYTIMADSPTDWQEKMGDIGMLLENINAVLNLLRPHQAREGVKTMLLNRLEAGKEEMARCEEMKSEVEQFLRSVEHDGKMDADPPQADGVNGAPPPLDAHESVEAARRRWNALADLAGD